MLTKTEAQALSSKVAAGQRLSAAEQASMADFISHGGWHDHTTEAAFEASRQRVEAGIKDAVSRGIKPGISSEPGKMIPPPPSFDPFHGKVCLGPGLEKGGFGKPRICGRPAVAVVRTFHPEDTKSPTLEDQAAKVNAALATQTYAGASDKVYAGGGPRKGHMIPGESQVGKDERTACYFHSLAAHREHLHPDDSGGVIPEAKSTRQAPVIGLDALNPGRQWRVLASDPNFTAVTDGLVTTLVGTRDYVRYLAANGTLPEDGQPL